MSGTEYLRKCPLGHCYEVPAGTPDPSRCSACIEIEALRRSLARVVTERDAAVSNSQSAAFAEPDTTVTVTQMMDQLKEPKQKELHRGRLTDLVRAVFGLS